MRTPAAQRSRNQSVSFRSRHSAGIKLQMLDNHSNGTQWSSWYTHETAHFGVGMLHSACRSFWLLHGIRTLDSEKAWPKCSRPFIYGYGNVPKNLFSADDATAVDTGDD